MDSSFWDKINEKALEKCLNFFQDKDKNNKLSDINSNEDKSLSILEIFYKYKMPNSKENEDLKIVPNQKGKFFKFNELFKEKDINKNFKKM